MLAMWSFEVDNLLILPVKPRADSSSRGSLLLAASSSAIRALASRTSPPLPSFHLSTCFFVPSVYPPLRSQLATGTQRSSREKPGTSSGKERGPRRTTEMPKAPTESDASRLHISKPGVELFIEGATLFDRYVVGKSLGKGSYGQVRLATDLELNEKVALKIICKSIIKSPEHITRIKREVRITRLLNHPHIAKLLDVLETDQEIILCFEYISGGELFDFIVTNRRLSETVARQLFRQILSALHYCHSSSIIHRDLKPENILLDHNQRIRIIDFGFVNIFRTDDQLATFCGSPHYASPEMITGKKYTGPEVDIWSLGVILYAMLAGKLPFFDTQLSELGRKIATATYAMPSYFSEDAQKLIDSMLRVNPTERSTLDCIRHHPWTLEGEDGPPNSFIPFRPLPAVPLDPKILQSLKLYGFDPDVVATEIISNPNDAESTPAVSNPAISLYYLLTEYERAGGTAKRLIRHSSKRKKTVVESTARSSHEASEPNYHCPAGLEIKQPQRRKTMQGTPRQRCFEDGHTEDEFTKIRTPHRSLPREVSSPRGIAANSSARRAQSWKEGASFAVAGSKLKIDPKNASARSVFAVTSDPPCLTPRTIRERRDGSKSPPWEEFTGIIESRVSRRGSDELSHSTRCPGSEESRSGINEDKVLRSDQASFENSCVNASHCARQRRLSDALFSLVGRMKSAPAGRSVRRRSESLPSKSTVVELDVSFNHG
ncbi:kinase-like domain-containing protein [Zopfochytrium polystomum]|nr:kinase-like domain-containing protein [Zopfochytrium polystomum]